MKLTKHAFYLGCLIGGIGAAIVPSLLSLSHADTKLLPFQGRLTDASGAVIADGAKVVEFKMYDAPTGGNVKWAGEVQKLSINGGLANTMLGTKANLGSVDFSTPTYLQITIDSNNNGSIGAEDPPLLPRQSVIPAVFANEAGNSRMLAGFKWEEIITNGNPATGKILTSKLDNASGLVPVGTILPFAAVAVPDGYLFCDGASYPKAQYPALNAALNGAFGSDANNFNVPNLIRRVPVGAGGTGTAALANTLGSKGGEESHALTISEMPTHTHTDSGHDHASTNANFVVNGAGANYPAGQGNGTALSVVAKTAVAAANIQNTGGKPSPQSFSAVFGRELHY